MRTNQSDIEAIHYKCENCGTEVSAQMKEIKDLFSKVVHAFEIAKKSGKYLPIEIKPLELRIFLRQLV